MRKKRDNNMETGNISYKTVRANKTLFQAIKDSELKELDEMAKPLD